MAVQVTSSADLKSHLQSLLDAKEKQLQQAGTLGQRVLAQQMELEERIRQLQEYELDHGSEEEEELSEEVKDRYRELAETLVQWDTENAQLSSAFGKSSSPSISVAELPREEPERQKPSTSAAAQSRRAKNAAHRADDVEFAFEIGSGLLNEVRRLQSLLGERDKAIQDMKEEKDDLEASIESLRTALRQQESSADKFKEENWNLEVTLQDLRTQLANYQSSTSRLEGETKRLTKLLATSRDASEQLKNENTALQTSLEDLTNKHETDIALARKHAAGLARDKSDLQQTVDTLKGEVARATRRWGGPGGRFGSPLTPNGGTPDPGGAPNDFLTPGMASVGGDDVFSTTNTRRGKMGTGVYADELGGLESDFPDDSPDASPLGPKGFLGPSHPSNEIEALQQRLAHAQRQIATLKGTLQREKKEKMELRKKVNGTTGEDEKDVDWEAEDDQEQEENVEEFGMDVDNEEGQDSSHTTLTSRRRGTPYKIGGRGRGGTRGRVRGRRGGKHLGLSWSERVSMAQADDDEANGSFTLASLERDSSPPPPVPPVPSNLQGELDVLAQEQDEEADQVPDDLEASPSPASRPDSRRASVASITSIDGMDPAYANHGMSSMLKRTPSNSSSLNGISPLRASLLRRSASKRSAASRTVGTGRRRGGMAYQEGRPPSLVDTPEDLAFALGGSPSSPASMRDYGDVSSGIMEELTVGGEIEEVGMVDIGIQCEPEPEPEVKEEPKKELAEMAIQSEPEPVPEPEPKPVLVDMSMQTDAEPVPTPIPTIDAGIQHEPILVDQEIGTDPVKKPLLAEMEIQTIEEKPALGLGIGLPSGAPRERERTTTITQRDVPNLPYLSTTSRSFTTTLANGNVSEGEETETGDDETETGDESDYQDARQSVATFTASAFTGSRASIPPSSATESRDDFHSIMTMTDNELSDGEDDEDMEEGDTQSIHVSQARLSRDSTMSVGQGEAVQSQSQRSSFYGTPASSAAVLGNFKVEKQREFDEKGVEADLFPLPAAVPEPVTPMTPKPEVREISIQTDEWIPSPPASANNSTIIAAPVPVPFPGATSTTTSPSSPVMYRVGSGHQFQFIPPPASSSNSTSSSTGAVAPAAAPTPSPSSSIFRSGGENAHSGFITIFPRGGAEGHARRQSMDSVVSSVLDDTSSSNNARSRISSGNALSSTGPTTVDKSKPPMMSLPPPPRAPPPHGSMPPPSFIPERRMPTTSSSTGSSWDRERDVPPPRPSSPPPPELIQRATTPTFGSALIVPPGGGGGAGISTRPGSGFAYRQHGSSMPPSQAIRQPPSTSSFRSAANATNAGAGIGLLPSASLKGRDVSTASLLSEMASPRSSMSSDHGQYAMRQGAPLSTSNNTNVNPANPGQATPLMSTPNKLLGRQVVNPTDPAVIHAITQTMIGEFLYKYTRKAIGKGYGTARHRRFFWVHPYTKTLYWSSADPNSTNVAESSAKSAYIEGVRQVLDPNPMPPGLYQYSVVVSTPQREMKFTAPTKERHEIWLNSLKYLLSRPNPTNITSPANTTVVPGDHAMSDVEYDDDNDNLGVNSSPSSQRTGRRSTRQETSFNTTPRGKRSRSQLSVGGSIGRRAGTPAAEYLRWNAPESPYSPTRSFVDVPGGGAGADEDEDLDFELHGDSLSDEGFEGLENVRACCDGRHTVGHSGKHHHHHHHHPEGSQNGDHTGSSVLPAPARPISPSGWSFRSRAGSTHSHEGGGGGLFSSWGRGELRFGSKRSTKTNQTQVSQAS